MVRRMPTLVLVVTLALVGVPIAGVVASPHSGVSVPVASDATLSQTSNETAQPSALEQRHPPDPAQDQLGWENGYWYNESIDVTPANGLNDSELDAVVARGMARVEQIRNLEFGETPPVEVINRESFRERVDNETSNMTENERLHQNVKYEALMMVNESTDATDVQADNQGGGVGGFYDPSTGEIKIVSENTSTPKMDEITLSQELFHALQDQHFNISSFNQSTQERHNAKDGIIEGDGNYVDHLYQQRCENGWNGACIMPEESQVPSDFSPHFGLYQIQIQPYSDGPWFVRQIHQANGWDAVDAVYDDPPASTEQTIHPEKYGVDEPTEISVPDQSDDRWRELDVEDSINYASFGEAGLYVTLLYPGLESGRAVEIIPVRNHINLVLGSDLNPYNYNHTYTAGWDGDKLVPYVTDESVATNETGFVYKMVWDSPEDAREFREGYEQLLDFHGADPVEGRVGTYRIPPHEEFDDAFYIERTGERLLIVNAPTVEELSAVHEGAAPTGAWPTTEETTTRAGTDEERDSATSASGPGFTVLGSIAGLVALILVGLRRR